MKNLLRMHVDMRPQPGEVARIHGNDGTVREDAALVFGLSVRLVGWFEFAYAALTGRVHGVLIPRGNDGLKHGRPPAVLLDWETYSTLLLMAEPQRIPDVTDCSADAVEMGGTFR